MYLGTELGRGWTWIPELGVTASNWSSTILRWMCCTCSSRFQSLPIPLDRLAQLLVIPCWISLLSCKRSMVFWVPKWGVGSRRQQLKGKYSMRVRWIRGDEIPSQSCFVWRWVGCLQLRGRGRKDISVRNILRPPIDPHIDPELS